MATILLLVSTLALCLLPLSSFSTTSSTTKLSSKDSYLTVGDFLLSTPKGVFEAGFFSFGDNAYCFGIRYTEQYDPSTTIVWMVNRDRPVNRRYTKLALTKSGNLVLTDAGQITVWTSNTFSDSNSPAQLQLHDNGNLILTKSNDDKIIWQSFDYPTDTLLPHQLLTESASLVSSRSSTNHSSGFYKLFFDNDNVLRLMYKGPEITSVFWPDPWLNSWEGGRSTYNNSKVAMFDSSGSFLSSDELKFNTSDYSGGSSGSGIPILRRLTLDVDGNLRIHSLNIATKTWEVSWQAVANPCSIHGICGGNGLCTYSPYTGRKCTCLPGYKRKNLTDWTDGCVPDFQHSCGDGNTSVFLQLPHVEFYGFDFGFFQNYTLERCESLCLQYCDCKGFQYKFDPGSGSYNCFPKTIMFNGYNSIGFEYPIYLRLPKELSISLEKNPLDRDFSLQCRGLHQVTVGSYGRKHQHGSLKSFFWSTCAVGVFEIICLLAYFITTRMQWNSSSVQGYSLQVATGFRKFTYSELKKATGNFRKEIGRGGGGIVYKGVLTDNRVAAIKCLKEANQGEAEFLAEVSIIGRLNHMNLIEIWGYCAEGKRRLLVYEYMEHGSLRKNLQLQGQESSNLDWKKRYEIALGTARGLAYLHEECLEWVLHCDVKPENILLSDSYQPKVADFGLSKLLIRDGCIGNNQDFSRIRGTRGYMAPEWVFNLPITSKVDVYSYGIVVLEMVTGRSPSGDPVNKSGGGGGSCHSSGGLEPRGLVNWVRENWRNTTAIDKTKLPQIQHLLDPAMNVNDECDVQKMATLIEVALQCSEEDKDSRPTMSQVVDMLQPHDIDK